MEINYWDRKYVSFNVGRTLVLFLIKLGMYTCTVLRVVTDFVQILTWANSGPLTMMPVHTT
jgi:hypothetical protein